MQSTSFNEQERIAAQLEAIQGRFEELSIRITLPEVIADTATFTRLMRQHSELSELNDVAVSYRKLMDDIEGAREMLLVEDIDDRAFLTSLVTAMAEELPAPKMKKVK